MLVSPRKTSESCFLRQDKTSKLLETRAHCTSSFLTKSTPSVKADQEATTLEAVILRLFRRFGSGCQSAPDEYSGSGGLKQYSGDWHDQQKGFD